MSGFFTGILKICLLVSAPVALVSGQDVEEERIDQWLPFNKSLLIYTEASQNLENVTGTIAGLNEAIKETTKLKNEVKKFFIKYQTSKVSESKSENKSAVCSVLPWHDDIDKLCSC